MDSTQFRFHSSLLGTDSREIFARKWLPTGSAKACVLIAHGMAEHSERYTDLAKQLVTKNYAVYALDHRGHGYTESDRNNLGFFADIDGWEKIVEDFKNLSKIASEENRNIPLFLLGHSMGSFLVQDLIIRDSNQYAGAILSATNGGAGLLGKAGIALAKAECLRIGKRKPSLLLHIMTFGDFNRRFAPTRTEFDWLSRDESEVDKYIADPLCGFNISCGMWLDVLRAMTKIEKIAHQKKIRKDLPVYLFSGSEDPVSNKTKGVKKLIKAYQRAGLKNISYRFYPGARHETLNETNKQEVINDLLFWLDSQMKAKYSH